MKKWEQLLKEFEEKETVTVQPDSTRYWMLYHLRKRGHNIVNVAKYQYKLL